MKNSDSAFFLITLADQTGALQRLLGVIRRRGFKVDNMMVARDSALDRYRIEFRLKGNRSFETLARHIDNLFDVSAVSFNTSTAPWNSQYETV